MCRSKKKLKWKLKTILSWMKWKYNISKAWAAANAVLSEIFLAFNTYNWKKKKKTSNQSLQLQTLKNLEMKRIKPKVSSKDISEIKAETKVIENRKK